MVGLLTALFWGLGVLRIKIGEKEILLNRVVCLKQPKGKCGFPRH